MRARQARLFHSLQAQLGEGPVWDSGRGCLWCVDITAPAVHCIDPSSGERQSWPAPARIGWVLPGGGEKLIAGLADGLYEFSPANGTFNLIVGVEPDRPGNRINDGTRAPDGSIWFGTMDDAETAPTGRFYRFDGRLQVCDIAPVCITNGPAVSPDGRLLYTVDTLAREIRVSSITEGGGLLDGQLFAVIAPEDGWPDGISCDRENGIWVGLWGGWRARRYDAAGRITDEVRLPAANVTKVALGGPDGRTAFATTARIGLGPGSDEDQPLAGDVFCFEVDVGAPQAQESRDSG